MLPFYPTGISVYNSINDMLHILWHLTTHVNQGIVILHLYELKLPYTNTQKHVIKGFCKCACIACVAVENYMFQPGVSKNVYL